MPEVKDLREAAHANSKETYYLRCVSRWRLASSSLPLLFGLMGTLMFLRQQGVFLKPEWLGFGLVASLFGGLFYLSRRLSTAQIAITLDVEGVHQAWLRQFVFASNPDITIRWTDMADYKFELEPGNDWFKVTLKDGTIWRFHRDLDSFKKDDFSAFRAAFTERVERYNQTNAVNHRIRRAKTFLETQVAYVLAKTASVSILAFPVVLVILAFNNSPATELVGISGAVAFVPVFLFAYSVHIRRKERREYERTH